MRKPSWSTCRAQELSLASAFLVLYRNSINTAHSLCFVLHSMYILGSAAVDSLYLVSATLFWHLSTGKVVRPCSLSGMARHVRVLEGSSSGYTAGSSQNECQMSLVNQNNLVTHASVRLQKVSHAIITHPHPIACLCAYTRNANRYEGHISSRPFLLVRELCKSESGLNGFATFFKMDILFNICLFIYLISALVLEPLLFG